MNWIFSKNFSENLKDMYRSEKQLRATPTPKLVIVVESIVITSILTQIRPMIWPENRVVLMFSGGIKWNTSLKWVTLQQSHFHKISEAAVCRCSSDKWSFILILLLVLRCATSVKKDPSTGVFLWILQNF